MLQICLILLACQLSKAYDDRQSVNDVKAIVKGRAMYESNRILACSINNHNDVYLTGMVAAAMKQKVTYSYKIRIDRNTGDPLNSHCECPAGRGPHGTCKHIAAVCLMMEDFTQNGKIRVAKSATENLMSFNKPKSSYRENIALNKSAWQQYPFWPGFFPDVLSSASNAVDGQKTDLNPMEGQCVISSNYQQTATWRVDLADILSIHHITIVYRTDNLAWDADNQYTGRFLGFSLYVSNTTHRTQGHLCFHDTSYTRSTIPAVLNVTCPVHGRYVIYYNERLQEVSYPSGYSHFAFNELCEVEVYGCPVPGYYGPDCSIPCDTNCRYCNIENGACQKCNQYELPCPRGWHGDKCSVACSNCDICDRCTGKCTSPCYPGWKGQHCSDECDGRKYGFSCLYDCGSCIDHKQCHHINGSCLQGCDAGFEGELCKTVCTAGFYGINCQGKCNTNCAIPGRCNKTTGQCDGGCKPGWRGILCDTKCGDNLYGQGCNQKCGKCKEGEQCHHINGSCNDGCGPGYRGNKCDTACEFGYFGSSCKEECSVFCKKSRDCHHVTGYCRSGCKAGWHGNDCLEVDTQAQCMDSERNCEMRFYSILCAFCVLLFLNGVYAAHNIRKWNKRRLEKCTKYCARDSTICTKDKGLRVPKDGKINNAYQELGELSPSSLYDAVH